MNIFVTSQYHPRLFIKYNHIFLQANKPIKLQFSTPVKIIFFVYFSVNVGLFCSTPAVAVGRAVPRKVAMEMLFTGHPISAQGVIREYNVERFQMN
jgi:hypothetical protein